MTGPEGVRRLTSLPHSHVILSTSSGYFKVDVQRGMPAHVLKAKLEGVTGYPASTLRLIDQISGKVVADGEEEIKPGSFLFLSLPVALMVKDDDSVKRGNNNNLKEVFHLRYCKSWTDAQGTLAALQEKSSILDLQVEDLISALSTIKHVILKSIARRSGVVMHLEPHAINLQRHVKAVRSRRLWNSRLGMIRLHAVSQRAILRRDYCLLLQRRLEQLRVIQGVLRQANASRDHKAQRKAVLKLRMDIARRSQRERWAKLKSGAVQLASSHRSAASRLQYQNKKNCSRLLQAVLRRCLSLEAHRKTLNGLIDEQKSALTLAEEVKQMRNGSTVMHFVPMIKEVLDIVMEDRLREASERVSAYFQAKASHGASCDILDSLNSSIRQKGGSDDPSCQSSIIEQRNLARSEYVTALKSYLLAAQTAVACQAGLQNFMEQLLSTGLQILPTCEFSDQSSDLDEFAARVGLVTASFEQFQIEYNRKCQNLAETTNKALCLLESRIESSFAFVDPDLVVELSVALDAERLFHLEGGLANLHQTQDQLKAVRDEAFTTSSQLLSCLDEVQDDQIEVPGSPELTRYKIEFLS